MGPSGAGKSTLLDLMAGRITTGKHRSSKPYLVHRAHIKGQQACEHPVWVSTGRMGGEVFFNGLPTKEAWRRLGQHLVYIRQGDVHLPMLTVRETLTYAARFHLVGRPGQAGGALPPHRLAAMSSCKAPSCIPWLSVLCGSPSAGMRRGHSAAACGGGGVHAGPDVHPGEPGGRTVPARHLRGAGG